MRTYSPKASEIDRAWHVVDAEGLVLGRLGTEVARLLRGKHKPIFAPHIDTGDHVIDRQRRQGRAHRRARPRRSRSYRHSGYPGGLKSQTYADLLGAQARRGRAPHDPGHAAEEPPRPPACSRS